MSKRLSMALITALSCAAFSPLAHAIPVFDGANYAQNLLSAARALRQINNQITQLQNEARMLANDAKNLATIDFPQLEALQARLELIDELMGRAQAIDFRLDDLDEQFRSEFPARFDHLLTHDERLAAARKQLEDTIASFRQTMAVQSGVIENVRSDAQDLAAIVAKSQDAQGSLQAAQATNQLLALTARQQFQIQQLLAAQFRDQSLDAARRGQSERKAHERLQRFLGDGKAYTPRP
ncbi:P-type conjugative transfer protein TrbJ [Sphingopyxis indica]|uniref:P-type conjugative transfer protein TrbJ n=1 Tax=Sphingopyxis indica TaxID=436663 RepID=UPI002938FE50|nr:P-type conjugative transfer protein TrbJ [Sphingopyxis indica]WOF44560.1 P-type conjugative transfer protein TrbJ [Sphingopyxis indica]